MHHWRQTWQKFHGLDEAHTGTREWKVKAAFFFLSDNGPSPSFHIPLYPFFWVLHFFLKRYWVENWFNVILAMLVFILGAFYLMPLSTKGPGDGSKGCTRKGKGNGCIYLHMNPTDGTLLSRRWPIHIYKNCLPVNLRVASRLCVPRHLRSVAHAWDASRRTRRAGCELSASARSCCPRLASSHELAAAKNERGELARLTEVLRQASHEHNPVCALHCTILYGRQRRSMLCTPLRYLFL